MDFFENCYLQINEKRIDDFYLLQEQGCIKYRQQDPEKCLILKYLDMKSDRNEKEWKFECTKCQIKISIVHDETQHLERMFEKLRENGLQLQEDFLNDSAGSLFELNQTQTYSAQFQFEEALVNSKLNSTDQNKNFLKECSSMRFKVDQSIEKSQEKMLQIENYKTRSQIENSSVIIQSQKNQQINSQSKNENVFCNKSYSEINFDPSNKIHKKQNNVQCSIEEIKNEKYDQIKDEKNQIKNDNFLYQKSNKNKKKKSKNKKEKKINIDNYPDPIKIISKQFKVSKKIFHRRVSRCNNFDNILSNRINFENNNLEVKSYSQPYLSNKFSSGSNSSKIIFYSNQSDPIPRKFTNDFEIEGVKIQDVTIQSILKFNHIIGQMALKDYCKKTVNKLYQDFTDNQNIQGFYFIKDMVFLIKEYQQWQFSDDINYLLFEKFFYLYCEAQRQLENLILDYFSYRNQNLIINEFYVFCIRTFMQEIDDLQKSFDSIVRIFADLTEKENLLSNPLNYKILEFAFNKSEIEVSKNKLEGNFNLIEEKLKLMSQKLFKNLNFLKKNLKELLKEL